MSIAVASDPSGKVGKFAYVTHSDSNSVSMYSINAVTGVLQPIGTIAAGTSPGSVAVDVFGKFVYVANGVSDDVSMYMIDSTTGILQPISTVPAGASPVSVAVHPSGKFVYVANAGSNDVSMYMIDSTTGALEPLGPIAAGLRPTSVAVDPSGKFAYVTNANPNSIFELNTSDGNVSTYTIDASGGTLTFIGTTETTVYPRALVVDPTGKFAYVANCGDFEHNQGNVGMYRIDTSGILASTGLMDAGSCPLSLAFHPSGMFVYAANTGSDGGPDIEGVSMYATNPKNGTLTSLGFRNDTGNCPSSVAVEPSGKFAYVTNHCDSNISIYTIDAVTGTLALSATIGK